MSDDEQKKLVECPTCNANVEAGVRGHYDQGDEIEDETRFMLLECLRCHMPFLGRCERELYRQGNYIDYRWESGVVVLYPIPFQTALDSCVPNKIRRAFDEAVACYSNRTLTACLVMCRKTLEALCVEFGASGGTLASKLNSLRDNNTLDPKIFEWASMLRLAGNEAAHDVDNNASDDAKDVLDFTRALIDYMYVLEQRYQEYQNRRNP